MPNKLTVLQELIESYSKHPEQGLKACKKKLQKDPNNILYQLGQTQFLQILGRNEEALQLCKAIQLPPNQPADPRILSQIQQTVRFCQEALGIFTPNGGQELASLWKNTPEFSRSKELKGEMFRAAWRDGYWDLGQQLFATLQKENPSDASYHFAWVALSHIVASKASAEDKMGQSLKLLANRSIQAAVENSLNHKDTARKIDSQARLRLVCEVYRRQGNLKELLDVLNSPEIGISSPIGKNDFEFIKIKIQSLKELERWDELRTFCMENLTAAGNNKVNGTKSEESESAALANDWFFWESLIEASEKSGRLKGTSDLPDLIKRYDSADSSNRNVGIANLTLQKRTQGAMLSACKAYFDLNCKLQCCFDDLRDFVVGLAFEQEKIFLDHIHKASCSLPENTETEDGTKRTKESFTLETNILKFSYLLTISKPRTESKSTLEEFLEDCLRVYKRSLQYGREHGSEVCVLAAMALIRLHYLTSSLETADNSGPSKSSGTHYLVKATILLSEFSSLDQSHYPLRLLLLHLLQLLGLGTLELFEFQKLSIKEIQLDSLSHMAFTRISIRHPFIIEPSKPSQKRLPYTTLHEGIQNILLWYHRAVDSVSSTLSSELENAPFDKMIEFEEFTEKLTHSFTRALLLLEFRRLMRLTDPQGLRDETPVHPQVGQELTDQRDFKTIPDFEDPNAPPFYTYLGAGPKPAKYWLSRQLVNDLVTSLLSKNMPLETYHVNLLQTQLDFMKSNESLKKVELSDPELLVAPSWDVLLSLSSYLIDGSNHKHACSDPKSSMQELGSQLQKLNNFPPPLNPVCFPHWQVIQHMFAGLELLQAVDKFCELVNSASSRKQKAAKLSKIPADAAKELRKTVKKVTEDIQECAWKWQGVLEKEGKKLVQELFVSDCPKDKTTVSSVVDADFVGEYAERMADSAVDALRGVLSLNIGEAKVRSWKGTVVRA